MKCNGMLLENSHVTEISVRAGENFRKTPYELSSYYIKTTPRNYTGANPICFKGLPKLLYVNNSNSGDSVMVFSG